MVAIDRTEGTEVSEPEVEGEGGGKSRLPRTAAIAGIALLAIAALGVVLVFRFVAAERQRDLRVWQISLGIIADTRAADVDAWIERQFTTVRDLAANESLQLYMTEIALADKPADTTEEPAQAGYLRNLLVATADREGFTVQRRGTPVNANVARVGLAGLALLDHTGKLLVATPEMPPIEGRIKDFLSHRKPGERALLDLYLNPEGTPTMGFLAPVFALQTDAGSAQEIGVVLGIRPVADDLYARLKQPGDVTQTAETDLVRRVGATIEYISPLADGTPPLKRALAADTPDLADAFAIATPGGFAERTDYAGNRVLVTGRTLTAAPWTIVRKVDASEALAETNYRSRVLLSTFLGAILLVAVLLVAVWRHATSLRASEAALRYRAIAERFSKLSHFLRVVTDSQPTAIAAVDAAGHYTFANKGAAAGLDVSSDDLIGKSMASVIGPARARSYEELNRRAVAEARTVSGTQTVGEIGAEHILRSQHVPLPG
ncbi:MAG TPA: PAS domain-containing protein, partial [Candidatus Sulfotelmatobacter sp.]|nr:PAS domain-containing protein [Candidatus Sulfotelmatobacter sp.]